MRLFNISIENKEYTPVENANNEDGCKYCSFREHNDLCTDANQIINCSSNYVYFVPASTVDLRPIRQQMQDWKPTDVVATDETQAIGTKYDQDKLQYSLIPPYALEQIAKNLTVGLKKYKERNNWKKVEGAEQRYLDALYRHLEAHRRGEVYDPESSTPLMPHLAAVAVNAMFLLEFMLDPELKQKDNK